MCVYLLHYFFTLRLLIMLWYWRWRGGVQEYLWRHLVNPESIRSSKWSCLAEVRALSCLQCRDTVGWLTQGTSDLRQPFFWLSPKIFLPSARAHGQWTLLQQNPPVPNRRCQLTQCVLYNGSKVVVVVTDFLLGHLTQLGLTS